MCLLLTGPVDVLHHGTATSLRRFTVSPGLSLQGLVLGGKICTLFLGCPLCARVLFLRSRISHQTLGSWPREVGLKTFLPGGNSGRAHP